MSLSFSQGCLFVEAYQVSGTKTFNNAQTAGTPINYLDLNSTPSWSGPTAVLLSQSGTNLGVLGSILLQVFAVSGSGMAGTVSLNMAVLNGLGATPRGKIWDAFTGNGRLQLTLSTSGGNKLLLVQLRALKSASYSLTTSTRTAACSFPTGCSAPNFNLSGESASNFTAEFQVNGMTLSTASFAPDDFSIPSGNLPSSGDYPSSTLALARSFSTDSSGNSVSTYSVPSNLPSDFEVT